MAGKFVCDGGQLANQSVGHRKRLKIQSLENAGTVRVRGTLFFYLRLGAVPPYVEFYVELESENLEIFNEDFLEFYPHHFIPQHNVLFKRSNTTLPLLRPPIALPYRIHSPSLFCC